MKDRTGTKCPSCHKGILKEMSLYDDWDGLLTCTVCSKRFPRWYNENLQS